MGLELPKQGQAWHSLRDEMEAMRARDLDWKHGRHGAYVWYAGDELEDVLRESFGMFLVENGLGLRAFPSIRRMEEETLATVQWLLSAPEGAEGIFTSGGTESIFLAIHAAREWARANLPHAVDPTIVAPHSAHPAVSKAAHYLGLQVNRIPVGADYRADAAAMEAAIDHNTIAIYASAPTYSLGLIDPIATLGELARRHGLWFHVDACVGGILAPFVRQAGHAVPAFDFAVPGVSSISADLHKSGYTAKPASTVTFRSSELRDFAKYAMDDWPSGLYSSHTFTGSRPGGAIAAAWAGMHFLGQSGYRDIAASSMRAKHAIAAGVSGIPGVAVHSSPELWAFSFGAEDISMGKVAGAMARRGWMCGATTSPPGIHVMCTPVHEPVAEEYVAAVAECIAEVRAGATAEAGRASYN